MNWYRDLVATFGFVAIGLGVALIVCQSPREVERGARPPSPASETMLDPSRITTRSRMMRP